MSNESLGDKFIETFREEALELLGTLESTLLELEDRPDDKDLVSAVFRVMHTIKGSAAMFGLDRISAFAHDVETILTALREGKIPVSSELIGNTLIARDMILSMLEDSQGATSGMTSEMVVFLESFRESVGYKSEGISAAPQSPERAQNAGKPSIWYIRFYPGKDAFRRGANPLALLAELEKFGSLVCIPDFENVPPLSSLECEDCLTGWHVFLESSATLNELRDVFIFVEDFSTISIDCLTELPDDEAITPKKLGEILVEWGKIDKEVLEKALGSQQKIGELLVKEKLVSSTDLKVALEAQKQMQNIQTKKANAVDMSTIRVKSDKLDQLMSLVGELVTIHARIMQTSRNMPANDDLMTVVEQFGRLTDELRSNTMSMRMVPIGTTFSSFKRLVRDLSAELGKSVELITEGGETELDKTVIEKLNDPLIHIIRNSLDHGIELPQERAAAKKSETGSIRLSAVQTGDSVHIVIEDDGHGLNVEAIRAKAVEKGLIRSDEVLAEQDLFRLIFAPGFSTKAQVSAVSGRGVGMDVVNRQMELINGTITIESKAGLFTRITLKIPLTLAIIEGLLVQIGADYFVIPLTVVVGCLEFIRSQQKNDSAIVIFHDRQLPFLCMRDFFGVPGERPEIEQMVVVHFRNMQFGLVVDQVIGGNQTVIKPIGKIFKRAEGVSSASILGDGSVALILDVEQIVDAAERADA